MAMVQHCPCGFVILENWNAGPWYCICKGGGDIHRGRNVVRGGIWVVCLKAQVIKKLSGGRAMWLKVPRFVKLSMVAKLDNTRLQIKV
jgi:hypothetical protein